MPYARGVRVGAYVDAYNLYYGGRSYFGRGSAGWRWLDVRALVTSVIRLQGSWRDVTLNPVIYCTAPLDPVIAPGAQADQDVYVKALAASGAVDRVEWGRYVTRTKRSVLAIEDGDHHPVVTTSNWPIMVQDEHGRAVPNARFVVSHLHVEEKGSDVNVATHLLVDVLTRAVDAAVVVSNDSDLELPVRVAREHVAVALVNPSRGWLAGALHGSKDFGVGGHWWFKLKPDAYLRNQLPDPVGSYRRPVGW